MSCRRALERDFASLLDWRLSYVVEALATPREDLKPEEEAQILRQQLVDGRLFVLEDFGSERLLAVSAFNAALPDTVQIGAVYTPPQLRGKGYARAVVAGQLRFARAEGVRSAILFSASPAAIRAYEAVGFRRIGEFGLVMLKQPFFPGQG